MSQRAVVTSVGDGPGNWSDTQRVSIRDDGGTLVVTGPTTVEPGDQEVFSLRPIGIRLSGSKLTWFGWFLIVVALIIRAERSARSRQQEQ